MHIITTQCHFSLIRLVNVFEIYDIKLWQGMGEYKYSLFGSQIDNI